MNQRLESGLLGPKEKEPTKNGVKISFSNSEVLRAYIFNHEISERIPTLAERMSGIREIPLGEFLLDGELFKSTTFTLVIEPDRNPRSKEGRPTAIIRADIKLGEKDSSFKNLQSARVNEQKGKRPAPERELDGYQDISAIERFLQESNLFLTVYSRNTIRINVSELDREMYQKEPVVLLQVWDKDAGFGSISISLFSLDRYSTDWKDRYEKDKTSKKAGWEVDSDDIDRWNFNQPVGVDVHNAERFNGAIKFYEKTFSEIMQALYGAEEVSLPNLLCEIETPMLFKDTEKTTFEEIGGQVDAIKRLRSRIATLKSVSNFREANTPFLLYGPPGNGKTSLAQAAANELQAPLVIKTTIDLPPTAQDSDFFNLLKAGYLEAKAAATVGGGKSVYCIEGIEALVGEGIRLQDSFLNLMDEWRKDSGNNVLIIATSNFPQNLHPGVISRFDAVSIFQPNAARRKEILEIHAKKINEVLGQNIFASVDMDIVAKRLDGFSGRDIERFLGTVYALGRFESQEEGKKIEIDTEFVLKLVPDRRLGFKTS